MTNANIVENKKKSNQFNKKFECTNLCRTMNATDKISYIYTYLLPH